MDGATRPNLSSNPVQTLTLATTLSTLHQQLKIYRCSCSFPDIILDHETFIIDSGS